MGWDAVLDYHLIYTHRSPVDPISPSQPLPPKKEDKVKEVAKDTFSKQK
jgi:hypothetical protein